MLHLLVVDAVSVEEFPTDPVSLELFLSDDYIDVSHRGEKPVLV